MIFAPQQCECPFEDAGADVINTDFTACGGTLLFMMMMQNYIKGRCDISTPCQRIKSVETLEEAYDFIVVGGGSAGPIVAGRLSENPSYSVLLLEAGGEEPLMARLPSMYRQFLHSAKFDWRYRTQKGNFCLDQGDLGCFWPRGKVLGGSSVLNGMMYHRGHSQDYVDWVNAGAAGWSWEENLPYFDMTEGNKEIGVLVSGEYHSDKGPLPVQRFNHQPEFLYDLMAAIKEADLPIIEDMNDPETPEGFNIAQTFNHDGQRYTTARAYLKPKSQRDNLNVKLNFLVSKLIIKGNKTVGVEGIDENGDVIKIRAKKEVILSAGALNSPHILLLSGIGPKEQLEKFNITVVADLPVGTQLLNHYGSTMYVKLMKMPNANDLDWKVFTDYLLERNGPVSGTGITQLTGLLYSSQANKEAKQPDLQFFFNGFYAECSESGGITNLTCDMSPKNISANAVLLRPKSVGHLELNSTDPRDPPLFFPHFFEHPDDIKVLIEGMKILKKIFDSPILQHKYGMVVDESQMGNCTQTTWSDDWLECIARHHTDPQNHQQATTAMGKVTGPDLRVYKVEGLRVIDASSMPEYITGNPQGAIMMVAERGAHIIKQHWAHRDNRSQQASETDA